MCPVFLAASWGNKFVQIYFCGSLLPADWPSRPKDISCTYSIAQEGLYKFQGPSSVAVVLGVACAKYYVSVAFPLINILEQHHRATLLAYFRFCLKKFELIARKMQKLILLHVRFNLREVKFKQSLENSENPTSGILQFSQSFKFFQMLWVFWICLVQSNLTWVESHQVRFDEPPKWDSSLLDFLLINKSMFIYW